MLKHTSHFHYKQIIGAREEQQDTVRNLIVSERLRLYVLADGMGGHQAGQLASNMVAKAFSDHIEANGISSHPINDLRAALQHANDTLAQWVATHPENEGMGTTLLALLLDEQTGRFVFISVGDSPLYYFENKQLKRINANHAFANDLAKLVAAGEMSANEAEQHPARHAITSAVMGKEIPHIDTQAGTLSHDALLLLASDGLQTLSDDAQGEIAHILSAEYSSLEQCADALLHAIEQKNAPRQDNTSLILLRLPKRRLTNKRIVDAPITQTTVQKKAPTKSSSLKIILWSMVITLLLATVGAALFFVLQPNEQPTPPSIHQPASAPQ